MRHLRLSTGKRICVMCGEFVSPTVEVEDSDGNELADFCERCARKIVAKFPANASKSSKGSPP